MSEQSVLLGTGQLGRGVDKDTEDNYNLEKSKGSINDS